jgi:PAS domain S-box-containing protein
MQTLTKDQIITALQAEVEALRTVISMTPGNVYWKDPHGNYLGCNKNVADVLQLTTPEQIIGRSDIDVIGPELAAKAREIDMEVLQTKKEKCLEEYGFNSDGTPATYLTRKTPLFDRNGKIQGVLGISFDITDRKAIEEKLKVAKRKAEAANQAKSHFLAMISHELRTPLTSILGFASLLEQSSLSPNKKFEFTKHIIDSGSYLLSLINSLLDYNKLETNKFELVQLPLNLKELTENVVSMLNVTASLKKLPLHLEYADTVPSLVLGNNRVIRQILINLIGNAIKFTDKGHVTTRVRCIKETATVATLEISVEDTGTGISPEEQQVVFKRFTQLGNVYTRNSSLTGTGLGLAIVKKLVKLLGGKICVKSALNKGSLFYFTCNFPKITQLDAPWLPYAANVKILVVQDNPGDNYIHTLLANTLYDIATHDEALNTLLSAQQGMQPYDIILIDHVDETLSNELLNSLRSQPNLNPPLPILISADQSSLIQNDRITRISLTPDTIDVKKFQNDLKQAWEKWLAQSRKLIPQVIEHPHVLIIEDNALIQIIHKHMLEELGCKVDVTESASQALEMLKQKYDMLFVDIGLPDIAGFDLIKKIRQQDDRLAEIPIIVLTGYSEDEERQHCLRAGANEISIKPVSKDTLAKILKRYMIK